MAGQTNWSDQTKCTKLIGALPMNLTGVTSGMSQSFTYSDLIKRLDVVHGSANAREAASLKLGTCQKGAAEPVSMFAERVRQLTQRAFPSPDYTPKAREEQALKLFLQALPNKCNMRTTMCMQNFKDLSQAVEYGTRFEMIMGETEQNEKRKNLGQVRKCDEVSEFQGITDTLKDHLSDMVRDEVKEEISRSSQSQNDRKQNDKPKLESNKAPFKREKKTPQNSPCHGCGQLGHWKPECLDNPRNGRINKTGKDLN